MTEKNLILEAFSIYQIDAIIKTNKKINKIDVFNGIRAVSSVITVSPIQLPQLEIKNTDSIEYSYIRIKYLVSSNSEEDIQKIKSDIIHGTEDLPKIPGLLQFIIREPTNKKIK
jgi:hypothetical protein